MDLANAILVGIVIAIVSGVVGSSIGVHNKVTRALCVERRGSCQALLIEKIDNLVKDIETLTKAVNNRMFNV